MTGVVRTCWESGSKNRRAFSGRTCTGRAFTPFVRFIVSLIVSSIIAFCDNVSFQFSIVGLFPTVIFEFGSSDLLDRFSGGCGGLSCIKMPPSFGKKGMETSEKMEAKNTIDERQLLLLRKTLGAWVKPYLEKNPSILSALNLISDHSGCALTYDHFAFRSFGTDGFGINSMASFFLDFGYKQREELLFPGQKLRAIWYSPPEQFFEISGSGVDGPLPRIVLSEVLVEELSDEAQAIIKKYTSSSVSGNKYSVLAGILNAVPWPTPLLSDYEELARESEYAAWTLVHGYALGHLTLSVHQMLRLQKVEKINQLLLDNGIRLNTEGGLLKVTPDGCFIQSSTVAGFTSFTFADGEVQMVPASFLEFAERLVLPEFKNVPENEVREWHRRDGFEVGNANKILLSTFSEQTGCQ